MMLDSRSGMCFGSNPFFDTSENTSPMFIPVTSESKIIFSKELCIRERSIYFRFCN